MHVGPRARDEPIFGGTGSTIGRMTRRIPAVTETRFLQPPQPGHTLQIALPPSQAMSPCRSVTHGINQLKGGDSAAVEPLCQRLMEELDDDQLRSVAL